MRIKRVARRQWSGSHLEMKTKVVNSPAESASGDFERVMDGYFLDIRAHLPEDLRAVKLTAVSVAGDPTLDIGATAVAERSKLQTLALNGLACWLGLRWAMAAGTPKQIAVLAMSLERHHTALEMESAGVITELDRKAQHRRDSGRRGKDTSDELNNRNRQIFDTRDALGSRSSASKIKAKMKLALTVQQINIILSGPDPRGN